ncbi:MAG: LVIVD repeat-containing protein [Candidatus Zixiibacteriota bacterium]
MSKYNKTVIFLIIILIGASAYSQETPIPGPFLIPENTGIEFLGHTMYTLIRDVGADEYFFALYNNTVEIYDIQNPDLPELLTFVYFPGQGQRLFAAGDYLYIAGGDEGLFIIDISMIGDSPRLAGRYQTPGFARDVYVEGNLALVADSDSGLVMVDVTDPENPVGRGSYQGLTNVYHVCANGSLVCIADTVSQAHLTLIYSPDLIIPMGTYISPKHIHEIDMDDSYLYLASDTVYALQIVDISAPSAPSLSGNYSCDGLFSNIQIVDTLAYVLAFNQLNIINLAEPANPAFVAEAGNTCGGPIPMSSRFTVTGERVYSSNLGLDYCNYICVADITNPFDPSYVAGSQRCLMPVMASIQDSIAFITSQSGNFCFLNIKDPTQPQFINDTWTSAYAYGIQIQGSLAYVAAGFMGLDIFDISDLNNPVHYPSQISDEVAFAIEFVVRDTLAFLAAGSGEWGGLAVFNVKDCNNVFLVSRNTKSNAAYLRLKDNRAYVVDMFTGLHIYDITDPAHTEWLGEFILPELSYAVTIQDTLAYVGNDSGLYIVNVTDPESPVLVHKYATSQPVIQVLVRDSLAYLANELAGLQVLKIKDPANPVWLETYDTPGSAQTLALKDSLICLVDIYSVLFLDDPYYDPCCEGLTGNVNCSEEEDPDIADITALIDHLYLSHTPLCCPEEANCNGVGDYPDIADITAIIDYLYLSHDPLAACP